MDFLRRKFGTLVFLVLVIGLAGGYVLAQKGAHIDLGTVAGIRLVLAPAAKAKTAQAGSSNLASFTSQGGTGSGQQGAAATTNTTASQGTTGRGAGRPTSGTITNVNGSTITLTGQNGSATTVVVSSTTTVVKSVAITAADLKTGDTVTVNGQVAADGAITARQVMTGALIQGAGSAGFGRQGATGTNGGTGFTRQGNGGAGNGTGSGTGATNGTTNTTMTGTVQKIDSTSLTVLDSNGQTTTVALTANTTLRKLAPATLADLTNGMQATVIGQTGSDGGVAANVIQISPAG